nr:PAS domain-containing protein [Gemmatimonadota bacterium]
MELNVERDQLSSLLELAPAFIAWTRGPEHVVVGANLAYRQLVGFRDIIGKPVAGALPELVPLGIIGVLDGVLATGEPFIANGLRLTSYPAPGVEPEERFANLVCQPIVEADGTRSGVFYHGVDVTEQVRAANTVMERKAHLRRLLNSLPIIVYQAEAEAPHATIYVNRAIESLGYTYEEWLARPDSWDSRVHRDDRERVRAYATAVRSSDTVLDCEYRLLAKDGTVHWFRERGEFIQDLLGDRTIWQGILLEVTGERLLLEELRESEVRNRTIVETAHEGIWVVDALGNTTYVNPRMCEMLGHSASAIHARSFFEFTSAASEPGARTQFARRQRGVLEVHDVVLQHRDGHELFALISTSPILAGDGQIDGALMMVTDITTRRLVENALRESEARYRLLVANSPGAVYQFSYRPDGSRGFTFVSEGVLALLGISADDLMADSAALLAVVHEEDRSRLRDLAFAAAMQERPFNWEGRVRLPSGEERFIELVARYHRAPDGTVLSDGVLVDVTERRRAFESLKESETRFHLAARAAHDVVYDWNIVADEHFWSEALLTAFGYRADDVQATFAWWTERIHPDDAIRVTESLAAAMRGAGESWQEEYRFRRHDGSYASVLDRGYVMRDEANRPVRLVGSMIDLTKHRTLEEQLRQSQKMEAVGRLAGGVAHDFNNLITVIRANSGFLLDDMDIADRRREDVLSIAEAADRAAGLTRQLLAFSRKQILNPSVLCLNDVVRNVQPMLTRLIGEDITVEMRLGVGLGNIMADTGQLEQVLINLAVNARDAMPDGGRLMIETMEVQLGDINATNPDSEHQSLVLGGDYVMLALSDTGMGMPADVRIRVFEPFFTTKEVGKGTGLGLATVYGIVKQSGGYIWVYSEPGEGTVFKLYFPRLAAAATALLSKAPEPHPEPGSETILLVEDEDTLRRLAVRILEREGYAVLACSNGKEALACATSFEGEIHLVLTDVVMPEMGGRGLAEKLRAVRPAVAVLYMSGYTDDDVVR